MFVLPFAVHISDGVLTWSWILGGFILAFGLLLLGTLQIEEQEIPKIGLLTAAFFVGSLIHVRFGPTTVHLTLNTLVGIILGSRAVLAVAIGLFMQASLLNHGGFTTLGVNCCVIALPGLMARPLFRLLRKQEGIQHWLVCSIALGWMLHPVLLFPLGLIWGLGLLHARTRTDDPFVAGFFTSVLVVFTTSLMNSFVLIFGGNEDWQIIAVVGFLIHLPVALIEGVIVGLTVSYLHRVQPLILAPPCRNQLQSVHDPNKET